MRTVSQEAGWPARFEAEGWSREGPPWLQAARAKAMQRFEDIGMPTRRTPSWEHTDARPLALARKSPDGAGRLDPAVLERAAFSDEAARLVLVDGSFDAKLSRLEGLPAQVTAAALRDVWHDDAFRTSQEAKLESMDALACLDLAFLQDGAFLHVPKDVRLEHPVHIVHIHTRPETATATRHVVLVGAGAEASIVESWVGSAPDTTSLHTTEVIAQRGAHVRHVKQQLEHPAAVHIGRVEVDAARDAQVSTFVWSEGGAWSRSDTHVRLLEEGAGCTVDGLWLGRRDQFHDHPTLIDHRAPHTTSRELYKGILDGRSHGVFLGSIIVRPDAQKVDAHQSNRNLLLSREARVDTTPQLEIHADDVKCAHGSTIGQLDADALFFLRARGIGRHRAALLLTKAFAGEALSRLQDWGIRTRLERRLEDWFGGSA